MTAWVPSNDAIWVATARPITSTLPPAGNGMITSSGRAGHFCAPASPARSVMGSARISATFQVMNSSPALPLLAATIVRQGILRASVIAVEGLSDRRQIPACPHLPQLRAKIGEACPGDRRPDPRHQLLVVGEVHGREQDRSEHLVRFHQMVQIGA